MTGMSTDEADLREAIRAEMGRQRLTMIALAGLTGIPRTTLIDQVHGNRRIPVRNLAKIAQALRIDLSRFIDGAQL